VMTKVIVHRGIIEAFFGSWMSGLGSLLVSGCPVHCDNAPTVRAMDGCFGNVIAAGHTVNQKAIRGKDIVYSTDGFVLEGFTPTKEWRKIHGRKNTPQIGESLEIEVSDGKEE